MKRLTSRVASVSRAIKFILALTICGVGEVHAAGTVQDDFTGGSASIPWQVFGEACLTAGSGQGTVPACLGNPAFATGNQILVGGSTSKLPDPVGSGALRLTNGLTSNYASGAILSPTPFPSNQGLSITFTTVTYGGDNDAGHGADGMSFFLVDGSRNVQDVGTTGGALGYSCAHFDYSNADGITAGYLGLGIDEYGNFLNASNGMGGFGLVPGRIGLRGAGTVNWNWLSTNYAYYYPPYLTPAQKLTAVEDTCTSGTVWDFSKVNIYGGDPSQTKIHVADYAALPNGYVVLPSSTPLVAPGATTRLAAKPISYKLSLTQDGYLSLQYSYNGGSFAPVVTHQAISALSPDNAIIPATFKFGFAASIGAGDNVHEILCFKAAPIDTETSSASVNTRQTGQLKVGSQLYLAYTHSDNDWGQLTAQNLVYNPTTQAVTISSLANWDGDCVLTGGACTATAGKNVAETPYARQIFTFNPQSDKGVAFQWNSLSSTQQQALNAGDSQGANRVAYLRGDRTNELVAPANFRQRTGVLGDIVDSGPAWVGPPSAPYGNTFVDRFDATAPTPPENSGQTYSAFTTTAGTRTNVVYVGANDGMLHGFEAGAYDSSGNYLATLNDGKEVLAYVPNAAAQNIHNATTPVVDYSSTQYGHAYFVDAVPASGDLFYSGAWHTWLVGGLGAGGNAIYALDVTDPTKFYEGNAPSVVVGEWANTNISCVGYAGCGKNLGQTYGTPVIRRLHQGSWAVMFGNGLNSSTGHAGMYVMLVGPNGAISGTYFLDTGVGSAAKPDGITSLTPVDLDGDHITDFVYAGDVQGNIWRFDLTSVNPESWSVSPTGPLFTTAAGQPISTQVQVASVPAANGAPRLLVEFATGLQTPQTLSAPISYATGTQAIYGIWDSNFSAWNAKAQTQAAYASLPAGPSVDISQLEVQTILSTTSGGPVGLGSRTVSSNSICWKGSAPSCNQMGFVLSLPGTNEQVISAPLQYSGALVVNTIVPANNSPLNCTAASPTGWTMALDAGSGGALPSSFFDNANNQAATVGGVTLSGAELNATGGVGIVGVQPGYYMVSQTLTGQGLAQKVNPPTGGAGSRVTWIQVR